MPAAGLGLPRNPGPLKPQLPIAARPLFVAQQQGIQAFANAVQRQLLRMQHAGGVSMGDGDMGIGSPTAPSRASPMRR